MLGPIVTEVKIDVGDVHQPVPVPVVIPVDPMVMVSDRECVRLAALDCLHVAVKCPVVLVVVVTIHAYRDRIIVFVILLCRYVNSELVMAFLGVFQ